MTRENKIVKALEDHPCTYYELPGRISAHRMSLKNYSIIRRIRVAGTRAKNGGRCERLKTVYYLAHDEDRAIRRFIDVNHKSLMQLDFTRNNTLDSGLSREMARKIKDVIRQ